MTYLHSLVFDHSKQYRVARSKQIPQVNPLPSPPKNPTQNKTNKTKKSPTKQIKKKSPTKLPTENPKENRKRQSTTPQTFIPRKISLEMYNTQIEKKFKISMF